MTKIPNKVIIGTLTIISIISICTACDSMAGRAIVTKPSASSNISSLNSIESNNNSLSSQVDNSSKSNVSKVIVPSKKVVSSSVSSQKKVIKMTTEATNIVNSDATSQSNSSDEYSSDYAEKVKKNLRYGVINPETGAYVPTSDKNYEKYKAELGGDAGTVPDNKSTACQEALKKIKAKNELDATSSMNSSPN